MFNCMPSLYSCNLSSCPPKRMLRLSPLSSLKNNFWKCRGPCPSIVRWINPSMAMSRRSDNGAKLKTKSAVTASTPISSGKLSCTRSTCCSRDVLAWYIAAVRYSQSESTLDLYTWIVLATVWYRCVRYMDLTRHRISLVSPDIASCIVSLQSKFRPQILKFLPAGQ